MNSASPYAPAPSKLMITTTSRRTVIHTALLTAYNKSQHTVTIHVMLGTGRSLVRGYPEVYQDSRSTQLRREDNHETVAKVPALDSMAQRKDTAELYSGLTIANDNAESTKRSARRMCPPGRGRYAIISPRDLYESIEFREGQGSSSSGFTHHDTITYCSNQKVTQKQAYRSAFLQRISRSEK